MDEIQNKLSAWRAHPRGRRAARALLATLASPVLLAGVAILAAVRRPLPRTIDRAARRIFDQQALPALAPEADPGGREDTSAWATVAR